MSVPNGCRCNQQGADHLPCTLLLHELFVWHDGKRNDAPAIDCVTLISATRKSEGLPELLKRPTTYTGRRPVSICLPAGLIITIEFCFLETSAARPSRTRACCCASA